MCFRDLGSSHQNRMSTACTVRFNAEQESSKFRGQLWEAEAIAYWCDSGLSSGERS